MSETRKIYRLRDVLEVARSPIDMKDEEDYMLASIRRRNGGMFDRETKKGREILTKTLSRVIPGSFVISKMQVVHGACGMAPHDFGDRCISASYTSLLPTEPQRIDIGYLDAYATTKQSYDAFFRASHGVHIEKMTFNLEEWLNGEIELPPLPEQKKIAEILSGIDKAISTKKQARNDLEAAREAICGELIQNGDWSQEEIGNLTSHMTNGFVGTATPHYRERGIKYLTSKNIRRDRIDTNRMIYISEEFHMANQKSSLRVGDVLMVQSGHIGTTAVVTNDYKDCNCHALILMRFNQEHLHPEYASLYLNSATGKTRLSDIFVGSTIKHVNTGDLRKFKIPVPPLDVQRDIANRVRSIDILLGIRDLQVQKLVILKQAISSDLLSGRKRVSV